MPTLIRPFAGLRPVAGRAADVAAPPYDVLNSAEARERAQGKPYSFLHISKPEIDLPADINPYDAAVYAKAAENLAKLRAEGVLVQDDQPCYYVYQLQMGAHVQTGLVAAASVADYDTNRIRKHEFTRPDKEDDRVRQIDALNAQTGPVLLAYRSDATVDGILANVAAAKPDVDITADDGIAHRLWVIRDTAIIADITQRFDAMPALYIADGHHRSASASRIAAARRAANPNHTGDEAYNYFLAVMFPHEQMRIFDYNRVVKDLHGHTKDAFIACDQAGVHGRTERRPGQTHATRRVRHVSRWPMVSPAHQCRARADRSGRAPGRESVAEQSAGATVGYHRSASRFAHRLRRRHSRFGWIGEARQQRRDAALPSRCMRHRCRI